MDTSLAPLVQQPWSSKNAFQREKKFENKVSFYWRKYSEIAQQTNKQITFVY